MIEIQESQLNSSLYPALSFSTFFVFFLVDISCRCALHIRTTSAQEMPGAEQAYKADHDQVQRNNEIQQAWHQQNQDAGNQGE